MAISGKYDFPGIKKFGAAGLSAALAATPWGAWLVNTWGVRSIVDLLLEWFVNWAANAGLLVLNIGAIMVEGEWDQKEFDRALDDAFKKIESAEGKLTPEQITAIDNEVIRAARNFIIVAKRTRV